MSTSLSRSQVRADATSQGLPREEFRAVRTRRTFEEVTAQVREMLLNGSLRPGDRLPAERELAQTLGIGRPALREALRALEASGLIELRRGKNGGAVISTGNQSVVSNGMLDLLSLGSVSITELFEARRWIQTSLVRVACARASDDDFLRLRENVARAEQLHLEGRADERVEVNLQFHGLLAEATRNRVALLVSQALTDALRNVIKQVGTDPVPTLFKDRRALIKALEARDQEAAAKAMEKILTVVEKSYKRLAEERESKAAREPERVT